MLHNTLVLGSAFHYGLVEQYAFSVLLFCICFVFYSFLATQGFSHSTATTQPKKQKRLSDSQQIDNFVTEVNAAFNDGEELLETTNTYKIPEPAVLPTISVSSESDVVRPIPPLPTTTANTTMVDSKGINSFVEDLTLRKARKAAKSLGIKQKVNGKDKGIEQFKREIRQALKKNAALLEQAQSAALAA